MMEKRFLLILALTLLGSFSCNLLSVSEEREIGEIETRDVSEIEDQIASEVPPTQTSAPVKVTDPPSFEAAYEGDHSFQVTTNYTGCGVSPGEFVTYPRITFEFEENGLTVSGENPESGRPFSDQYLQISENSYGFLRSESSVCEGANGTMIFSGSGITTSFGCGSEACFTQQWLRAASPLDYHHMGHRPMCTLSGFLGDFKGYSLGTLCLDRPNA